MDKLKNCDMGKMRSQILSENKDKINDLILKYDLDRNVEEKIITMFVNQHRYDIDIEVNEEILKDGHIEDSDVLKRSKIPSALIQMYYKKQRRIKDAPRRIEPGNGSKAIQYLNDIGYIWRTDIQGRSKFLNEDGEECREIVGYKPINANGQQNYHKKEFSNWFMSYYDCSCSYTDERSRMGDRCCVQIDHRSPENFTKDLQKEPFYIRSIRNLLHAPFYLQPMVARLNTKKRQRCAECMSGKDIKIPRIIVDKAKYKTKMDELNRVTKTCFGCYWSTFEWLDLLREYQGCFIDKYDFDKLADLYKKDPKIFVKIYLTREYINAVLCFFKEKHYTINDMDIDNCIELNKKDHKSFVEIITSEFKVGKSFSQQELNLI